MITLKSNIYSLTEKEAIAETMDAAREVFMALYCKHIDCRICEYRHLCYDVENLSEHARQLWEDASIETSRID